MANACTDCLSRHSDGSHAQGFAIAVSNKLTPMIIEVTPVNKYKMRLKICRSLCVISPVSVYAVNEASALTVKETFYAVLDSVVDRCPS